jgi:hypothetical protein
MSEHKYHVRQAAEFFPRRGAEHTAKGRFKSVRVLLGERNAPYSRIKHEVDGHERMGRRKRAWSTVIWRLRTGQPQADKAARPHRALVVRSMARKADVRLV